MPCKGSVLLVSIRNSCSSLVLSIVIHATHDQMPSWSVGSCGNVPVGGLYTSQLWVWKYNACIVIETTLLHIKHNGVCYALYDLLQDLVTSQLAMLSMTREVKTFTRSKPTSTAHIDDTDESDFYKVFSSASCGLNPAGTSDSSSSAFPLFSLSRTLYMTLHVR